MIKVGTGDFDDVVRIYYEGYHLNGEDLDESDDGPVPELTGFSVMVQLMKPGGKMTVVIPAEQAYGVQGNSNVEPHESLIFDIEAFGQQE